MREIHQDKGHGHDMKYSSWRRNNFPKLTSTTKCYTTDIDWLEWRNGKPVAVIECRRVIGELKTCEEVINHFRKLNNGFQLEVYARLAFELKIKAFVVAIDDKTPSEDGFSNSKFLVKEIIPPENWPRGWIDLDTIKTEEVGLFNEQSYAEFIAEL